MSKVEILMTPYYRDKVAQAIIDDEIDARLVEAIEADKSPHTALDKALKGKTPAEQIVIIAAVGATLGEGE